MNDMRLIDADAKELKQRININFGAVTRYIVKSILRDAPTIDAVPVVRCKDCALQGKLNCPMDEWVKPDDNGFCHHGKRKDGD